MWRRRSVSEDGGCRWKGREREERRACVYRGGLQYISSKDEDGVCMAAPHAGIMLMHEGRKGPEGSQAIKVDSELCRVVRCTAAQQKRRITLGSAAGERRASFGGRPLAAQPGIASFLLARVGRPVSLDRIRSERRKVRESMRETGRAQLQYTYRQSPVARNSSRAAPAARGPSRLSVPAGQRTNGSAPKPVGRRSRPRGEAAFYSEGLLYSAGTAVGTSSLRVCPCALITVIKLIGASVLGTVLQFFNCIKRR